MHYNHKNITQLYNEYNDALFSYGRHLGFEDDVIMDAMHDVFYRICKSENTIDNVENPKFYLFRALKNRLIDIYRSNKNIHKVSESIEDNDSFDDISFHFNVTVEDEIIKQEDLDEIRQKIESMLSNLTNRQREAMYFRYIHEYEYDDIAKTMQISVESCRNLISKSLDKLKNTPPLILVLIQFISKLML